MLVTNPEPLLVFKRRRKRLSESYQCGPCERPIVAEPQPKRLVGAGLALPSFHSADKLQGQDKPNPYETQNACQRNKHLRPCNAEAQRSENKEAFLCVSAPLR